MRGDSFFDFINAVVEENKNTGEQISHKGKQVPQNHVKCCKKKFKKISKKILPCLPMEHFKIGKPLFLLHNRF